VLAVAGRYHEAITQYDAVDRFGGDSDPVRRSRAAAYRRLGEHAKAAGEYSVVIERASETAAVVWDHYQRATPLWILGRREEAIDDYRRVRSLLGRPTFADARRFLILRELGRAEEARRVLDAALRDVQDDWLRQVLRCLAGEFAPEVLVADAKMRDHPEQICEALYYAGELRLLRDDDEAARAFFVRCVQTGLTFDPDTKQLTPMNEFELARWRLDSILPAHHEEN
jgi:tetratricopeptide (TPR) repeat protein